MNTFAKRLLSLLLCAVLVVGFLLVKLPKAQAAHYTGYGTVAVVYNQGDCYSMQGCDSDDNYIYCTKVNTETETSAVIARVHKDTGATTFLTNSATGTYYFNQLAHANDLDVVDINGVKTIFVATGGAGEGPYSLVRLALNGTTATEVAHYDMKYNGSSHRIAGAQVMSVEGDNINMIFLWGQYVYMGTIGVNQKSSSANMNHVLTLDFSDVTINGSKKDLSDFVNQGFDYYDGKIYVPLTGEPDYEISSVTCWDVIGASGTIKNNPNFSVWTVDSTFVDLSEIESVTICQSDGKMYFSTNRRKTSSDANWDGIHYVSGFTYDPSLGDDANPANYRWNTSGELFSSSQDSSAFNHAQIIKGTVSGSTITTGQYSLDRTVVLKHNIPWVLEWQASGISNAMLMSTTKRSGNTGNQYLYIRKDGLISFGTPENGSYHNYGINLTDHGLNTTASHTYRIENRIASDGSNMAYLLVDGKELGAMNQYFVAGTAQGTTSNWFSGKDFKFSYLGTTQHPISGSYSYIKVLGNGVAGQVDEANTMRWETSGNALAPINKYHQTNVPITKLWGSVSGSNYTGYQSKISSSVTLLHNRPWTVEWSGNAGGMLLASSATARVEHSSFLYRSSVVAFGRWNGSSYQNYGVSLSEHGIDASINHTYRLTNRINTDGSNMVYLYVDGQEIAPMNTHFQGTTKQDTNNNWISGKDFSLSYFGTYQFPVAGALSYVQVWENGIPTEQKANEYYWTPGTNTMISGTQNSYTANGTTILGGSNSGSSFNNAWYQMDQAVVLLHNRNWSIQWESEGSWKGSSTGAFLFSASQYTNEINAPYLYRRNDSDIIAFGVRWNNLHNNYGVRLSDYGIDGTVKHTYKLENRVNANGSNMVYLYVDGVEIAPMNRYYEGGTDTGTTVNWLNGKDFVFSYMGTPRFPIGNVQLSYLQIREGCTHSFGSWTIITPASCSNKGSQARTCSLCGVTETQTIAATDHSYTTTVVPPTCSAGGYTTYTCTICGYSYQGNQTAGGSHSYSAIVTPPSCGSDGYTTYTCSVCGDTYTGNHVSGGNHNYKSTVIEPTCTTGGYTTYRCSTCGDSYQSNATPATGHNYRSSITKPTCTAQGYTTYTCTVCGANYKGTYTSATGHSYQSTTVYPTCTTAGYTTKTCSGCGDQQVTSIAATGHNYQSVVIAPTCTSGGYTTYLCANCGHSYTDHITTPTGHSYSGGQCTTCGSKDPNYNPGATVPTLTLKSPTLEFKDMITVNAFYTAENIQDVVEMGMITYSTKVASWSVATAENVIPGSSYNASTGRYVSSSQGIHAKYLGDTVYLAIYAKLNDGTYAYSKLAGYSPVQYATSQLKNSTDTKLKQLVVAMLNYGAEAQLYFGHNTNALANASLTAEQKALPAAYNSGMVSAVPSAPADKQGIFANNQGFAKRTPSISFEGAFCINYFFTPKYAPDSGITMYYWTAEDYNANSVLTTSNATGKIKLEGEGTGQYQGDIEGIAAKALSEAVYVACAYKSGGTVWTSGVLGYSIGSYCQSQASKATAIADLAMATAVYGYQAKQYFG